MYAVIKTGGKQYRVKAGDVLKLETLSADVGSEIHFDEVLMITDGDKTSCGTPLLDKASVQAKVLGHGRHTKVKIIKFRRRKHHMKQAGHRQNYTQVEITNIKS
ncbi:MAG: 50S ribosomal protein L21 [Legionellaceae bacterium]|nr:50S ribosomal protein L21 [Legionellaceae bacterium]